MRIIGANSPVGRVRELLRPFNQNSVVSPYFKRLVLKVLSTYKLFDYILCGRNAKNLDYLRLLRYYYITYTYIIRHERVILLFDSCPKRT